MIPVQETFQCSACGKCCSHIKGFIPQEDRAFIEEYAFGKLPLVQVVPTSQMTFPLFDWEAKRFNEWKGDQQIEIKPLRVIYDLNTNKTIVVTYFIDAPTDACPFLQDNKCSIYNTPRAYVCRLFPFNKSPFQGEMPSDSMFGQCGPMEKLMPSIPQGEDLVPYLQKAFPNGEFLNAVQNDYIVEWVNQTIVQLIRNKKLRPAMNYPYDNLLKRIDNSEQIDFTDFLEEVGYWNAEERDQMITSFDQNRQAQARIEEQN